MLSTYSSLNAEFGSIAVAREIGITNAMVGTEAKNDAAVTKAASRGMAAISFRPKDQALEELNTDVFAPMLNGGT